MNKKEEYRTDQFDFSSSKDIKLDRWEVKFLDYPTKKRNGEINVTTNGPYMNPLSDGEHFNFRIQLFNNDGDMIRSVFLENCEIGEITLPRLSDENPQELVSDVKITYTHASEQRPGKTEIKTIEYEP